MLTIASQTFANGIWTITPDEPAALQLTLVGLGTMAIYAVWTGWRPRRTAMDECVPTVVESESTTARHAA